MAPPPQPHPLSHDPSPHHLAQSPTPLSALQKTGSVGSHSSGSKCRKLGLSCSAALTPGLVPGRGRQGAVQGQSLLTWEPWLPLSLSHKLSQLNWNATQCTTEHRVHQTDKQQKSHLHSKRPRSWYPRMPTSPTAGTALLPRA